MVFKIAKAELRNLFYSPVAWFLIIAFLVQCAYYYWNQMALSANMQDIGLENDPSITSWGLHSITRLLLLTMNGMFTIALKNLYLFVPLLTMGVIGREVQTGTIKLLFSSPVKLRQIVLGKYMAIMAFNILLVLIMGIFLVAAMLNIREADYGMMLSAALGFFLLTCAYTAIGIFMSSLTTYQIVAALGSFIIIFVLGRIGTLWQEYDYIRDLTWFLYLEGRTEKMLSGLITTKDIIYFVMVVYIFLGFTLIKLRSGRESKPWYVKSMRYGFVFVSALAIGYISSRPQFTGYWDTTAVQMNTIHERTQKIISDLQEEPLEVTLYVNLLGDEVANGFPRKRNTYLTTLWEQYQRFKPDIRFNYVYYYYYEPGMDNGKLAKSYPGKNMEEMAIEEAKRHRVEFSMFGPPEIIRNVVDLEPENYRLVMTLKYKERTELLRFYTSPAQWPTEQNVAAALKRLTLPVLPKILFVSDHYERSVYKAGEREYRFNTIHKAKENAMINLGVDFDSISLDTHDIPADITGLVLADPKTDLSETSLNKIRQFIDKGGNMFIIGEPGKQHLVNPVLKPLGVELMKGTLVEPTYDEMPDMVMPYFTEASTTLAEEPILLLLKDNFDKKITKDTLTRLMPGVVGISYTDSGDFSKKPLLVTKGERTWNKVAPFLTDSADIVFNPRDGDVKGSFPTVLQLARQINNKQQRIIVSGDADVISNKRILSGEFLGRAIYSWFTYGEFPIYIPGIVPKDDFLIVSGKTAATMKTIFVWVLPGLVLALATLLLIRRKRK